jgi:chromosome partitioning protein
MFHVKHSPLARCPGVCYGPAQPEEDGVGRIIAVANQKGGVGKTTTAVNLAACLAAAERRTILVDVDPQANATAGLGLDPRTVSRHTYHVLLGACRPEEALQPTALPTLQVIPASRELVGAEVELVDLENRESRLKLALQPLRELADYLVLDCPPSLGFLTLNALVAADSVLIPLQCEYYALEGLGQILETVRLCQQRLNPRLEIEGILLTMFDGRINLAGQVVQEVRDHFGERVFQVMIPRNVRLSEAPSHGKPVILYDIRCAGSEAYLQLAREVLDGAKARTR